MKPVAFFVFTPDWKSQIITIDDLVEKDFNEAHTAVDKYVTSFGPETKIDCFTAVMAQDHNCDSDCPLFKLCKVERLMEIAHCHTFATMCNKVTGDEIDLSELPIQPIDVNEFIKLSKVEEACEKSKSSFRALFEKLHLPTFSKS